MSIGKFFGCVMMIVGSAIGAGILAMPMVTANAGFTATFILTVVLWVILTTTGLLVVEASLFLPEQACSFNSMAKKTLGRFGQVVTWISYLLILYANLTAYVAGGPDLIFSLTKSTSLAILPRWLIVILFTFVLGMAVFWSTKATDHVNRGLMSVKGFFLVSMLVLVATYIEPSKLFFAPTLSQVNHVLLASAVLLNLFNYHFVVPSIRMYVGNKPQTLKWIVIVATTICLILYVLWLAATFSIIPFTGENSFAAIGGSTGELTRVLTALVESKWVKICIHGFANVTMTTAFLGVSLGLFDFLADGLKRQDTRVGRLQTALVTFLPPLLINILIPDAKNFLRYFGCAGIFIAILFIVLPPLMVYRLRRIPELANATSYHVRLGNKAFAIIFIIGLVFVAIATIAWLISMRG